MKRRSFLQMMLALAGLPFLPKMAAKAPPLSPHDPFCGAGEVGVPVGCVTSFSGTLPKDWLPCNGGMVSRSTYNSLFSAIGTAYGPGDGLTTFALPDFNASYLHGVFDPGHSHGFDNNAHSHAVFDPGHSQGFVSLGYIIKAKP